MIADAAAQLRDYLLDETAYLVPIAAALAGLPLAWRWVRGLIGGSVAPDRSRSRDENPWW